MNEWPQAYIAEFYVGLMNATHVYLAQSQSSDHVTIHTRLAALRDTVRDACPPPAPCATATRVSKSQYLYPFLGTALLVH